MAVPDGAQTVEYSVNQYGDNVEIIQTVKFVLQSSSPSLVDAAAEAAMEAFKAALQAANPTVQVYASRQYSCLAAGDAWPAA